MVAEPAAVCKSEEFTAETAESAEKIKRSLGALRGLGG
jgi:hypothetical protein